MKVKDIYLYGTDVLVRPLSRPAIGQDEASAVAEQAVREAEIADRSTPPALVKPKRKFLKSELQDVSDEAWTDFVLALKTASPGAVSASNALGMFELKIKRLADLGLVNNLACKRSPLGRMVWTGDFVAPMTRSAFLKDRALQYKVLCDSVKDYSARLDSGDLPMPDFDDGTLSRSGMLAVLHRCGPNGLLNWQSEARFPETVELYERANGIF